MESFGTSGYFPLTSAGVLVNTVNSSVKMEGLLLILNHCMYSTIIGSCRFVTFCLGQVTVWKVLARQGTFLLTSAEW